MADQFFDSNVLLYLFSGSEKAVRADALLAAGGVASVQVLNEFAWVARRKFNAPWPAILAGLTALRANLAIVPVTMEIHDTGLQLAERHNLPVFDAMILAAATIAGCETVYSEDMQDGFRVPGGPLVRNPFAVP